MGHRRGRRRGRRYVEAHRHRVLEQDVRAGRIEVPPALQPGHRNAAPAQGHGPARHRRGIAASPRGVSVDDDHATHLRCLPGVVGGQPQARTGPLRREVAVLVRPGPPGDERRPVRPRGVLLRSPCAAARPGRLRAVPARQLRADGPAAAPQAADPGQPGVHAEGGGRARAADRRADHRAARRGRRAVRPDRRAGLPAAGDRDRRAARHPHLGPGALPVVGGRAAQPGGRSGPGRGRGRASRRWPRSRRRCGR